MLLPLIESVSVVSKPGIPHAVDIVAGLFEWLHARNVRVRFDEQTAIYANRAGGVPRQEVADNTQLLIVLGGDGTLLSAARAIAGRTIPLLAVNLGGLGFLTSITLEELYPELELIFRGEHRIGERRLLHCELVRNGQTVAEYEALNDVVLTKASLARMIEVEVRVDEHFVCTYRADGLIIATPTGSTAYSLSAGGPIIFPSVEAICLTPICPHMLTNRPVLVPDDMVVHIIPRANRDSAYLTIDGQVGQELEPNDRIVCSRSHQVIQLIRPPKLMFFDVLREKLSWGER
jgi:NAD+ kinase